ncbi:MAG: hypothetical protein ABI678_01510 [Kofleriaceae bacterium]
MTKRREAIAFATTAAAIGAGFVIAQVVRAGEPLGLDQGLFACFGRWLRAGWLPYRDLFDSKPPLHLYTWVLAWAGGSTASAWWFEAIWLAATSGVAYVVARRWWGAWSGLAAAALVLAGLWTPGFGGYWSRLQAEELLVLPLLGAAAWAVVAMGRARAALACGACMGLVGLYKVPGLALCGAWLVLWFAALSPREAGRRCAWFAAGLVAPWLVASAWFAAHGAFGAFCNSVFVYQRHWIAMIDPPWHDVVDQFTSTATHELAPFLVAAAAGIALMWRRDRPRALCLIAWTGCAGLAVVLQRQLAGYHFLLLVPGLAFAAAYGLVELARRTLAYRLALVPIGALLALALAGWRHYAEPQRHGTFDPAAETAIAAYIAAHSQPSDGILIWALDPGIYALADRHPVTRFPFHRLLLTDARLAREVPGRDDRRVELLARIATDPPAFVVVGNHDANPFEPDSVTSLLAFRELSTIVQRDYHEALRTGHFVVLARNPATR